MKNSNTTRPQDAVTTQNADQIQAKLVPQRGGGVRAANPNCDTLPLVISIFRGELDNKPLRVELTWSQMVAKNYKAHWISKTKKGGQTMSPVSYKPNSKRGNAGVALVYCAVFDVEHHGPFDVMQEKLHGYAYLAHSSYSHTAEDPRFRIILPLVKPVPASEWPDAWGRLNQWLGGINDPSTRDAARIYYLPSHPPGATGHFIVSGEGEPLDIGELPELPPEQLAKVSAPATRNHLKIKIDGIEDAPPDALNPANGLERVVARCKFMADISQPEGQKTASRTIWMAMVSNASRFEESDDWIHDASRHHDGYDENTTDKLIQSCRDFGAPITCARIQGDGYAGCPAGGCKTLIGNVTRAPAGLWMGGGGQSAVGTADIDLSGSMPIPLDAGYYTLDGSFFVSDEGVFKVNYKDGEEFKIKIASKIENIAQSFDDAGHWGFLLAVTNPDGVCREWTMPRELLSTPSLWRGALLSMGADIHPSGDKDHLYDYLLNVKPTARVCSVSKPGWAQDTGGNRVFVLPNQVIGESPERFVLQSNEADGMKAFGRCGDLEQWKQAVAALCVGNSRLTTAVCVALTGPVLHLLGEENGGFHFVGPSSMGKTTAVELAASVWGRRDLFVKSWRTTDNALESIATRHNDTILILDEISQVNPMQAGEVSYMLGNGRGKSRADKTGGSRAVPSWRMLFLSTGEKSLAEHMETGKKQALAGQEIRLINLTADAGAGLGLFQNIHDVDTPQAFATSIKSATLEFYGVAGPAFVQALTSSTTQSDLILQIRQRVDQFVGANVPADASGQVHRVGRRFGLLAAVGETAIGLGILPWPEGEAISGARACFQSWVDGRGGVGNQEAEQAIAQVRRFLELHGESRFTLWNEGLDSDATSRTINRAGFRKVTDDDRTEYFVLPEAYRTEVCAGLNPTQVTAALRDRGLLVLSNDGKSLRQERPPGLGSMKVYRIKADILGDSE